MLLSLTMTRGESETVGPRSANELPKLSASW
jgi:hypothetical protein